MSLNGRKKNAPCLKRNLQQGSRGYSIEFSSLLKETSDQENKGNNISCGFTRTRRSGSLKKRLTGTRRRFQFGVRTWRHIHPTCQTFYLWFAFTGRPLSHANVFTQIKEWARIHFLKYEFNRRRQTNVFLQTWPLTSRCLSKLCEIFVVVFLISLESTAAGKMS